MMNLAANGWRTLLGYILLLSMILQVDPTYGFKFEIDNLPEGMSHEEVKEKSIEVLASLMEKMFEPPNDAQGRSLAFDETIEIHPCNTNIATLTVEELRTTGRGLLSQQRDVKALPYAEAIYAAMDVLLFATLEHDIQVWKVCGRCADFEPAVGVACEAHEYGYNATQSGLLFAPYDADKGHLLESTLPVNIISAAGGMVPSELWTKNLGHPLPLLGAFLTSGSRTYTVMPDNIGTGESEGEGYYKAFLIKQSLVTGIAPVLWQSEAIVSQESNCASAMGDAYVVSGYSEGGYGAVAVADALARMGKTIIACHAGGGAYRLSSATMNSGFMDVMGGNKHITFYITLLGAALSSTTTDVANYGKGEDFINADWRDTLVPAAQRARQRQHWLKMLIPDDEPLQVFNQELFAVYDIGISNGEAEPCRTSVTNNTASVCQALRDQDLVDILETANYPVYLCHSIEDEIIPFSNLPDMSANPYLHLKAVSGPHFAAGGACVADNLLYIANDKNVKNFPVQDKTCNGGCGCEITKVASPPQPVPAVGENSCNNVLGLVLGMFGISCHVGEAYSGLGFLAIDYTW